MKNTAKNQNQSEDSLLSEIDMKEEGKVLRQQNGQLTVSSVKTIIDRLKPQMAVALPKHMDSERLARIALTELRQTPALLQCHTDSLMKCLMVSAQLGLEPGLLGHVYFVPYGKEATIIVGYKGMIELARRSGQIASISAHVVYENDEFDLQFGLDEKLVHKPTMKDRGNMIAVYAIAQLVGGGHQLDFMSKFDVDKIRNQAKSKNSPAWVGHYEEMAKKTVVRRLFKYLPVSVELQKLGMLDESGDSGKQKDIIDNDFFDVDLETGEILGDEKQEEKSQASSLADKIK